MSGYTLQQLLAWCYDDHTIDSYTLRGNTVYIYVDGSYRELSAAEAAPFLIARIRAAANQIAYSEAGTSALPE